MIADALPNRKARALLAERIVAVLLSEGGELTLDQRQALRTLIDEHLTSAERQIERIYTSIICTLERRAGRNLACACQQPTLSVNRT